MAETNVLMIMIPVYVSAPFMRSDAASDYALAGRWLDWIRGEHPDWVTVAVFGPGTGEDDSAQREAELRACRGIVLIGGRTTEEMTHELAIALDQGLFVVDHTDLGPEPPQ